MLDMSSSMPIFTTPSETFSWASAANGDASNSAAVVAITPDLFIVTSQISALRQLHKSIVRLILPFFPHGVANPRFIDEVGASQAGEITRAEHAISVDRAFGCRRIFQILG